MAPRRATSRTSKRAPRPLDATRLEELAVAYVARFATTASKLGVYLKRKLRERGFEGEDAPDIPALVSRFVAKGYVEDAVWARSKSGDLLARGYGARRISDALRAGGIDGDIRDRFDPDELARREALLTFIRKRRFGPFGSDADLAPDESRKRREKQLAACLRAGHDFGHAARAIDAANNEEIEQWVEEARDAP